MARVIRGLLAGAIGLSLGGTAAARAAPRPTDGVLGRFVGTWDITGTTLGRPTVTGAEVLPDLGGAFLELHVKDPADRDHYEARVFIGTDAAGRLVVHWLDGTGGATSRTLGSGRVRGDAIELVFPYPDGIFRDSLIYDGAHDRWRLLIRMGPIDHPRTFSDWLFTRRR